MMKFVIHSIHQPAFLAKTRLVTLLVLTSVAAALLGFAPPKDASGPPGFGFGTAKPGAQQTFNDSRDRVGVSVLVSQPKVAPGVDFTLAVVLDHQPGWHSWTNEGNTPAGMAVFDGAIHTLIKPTTPADSPIIVHDGFIQWPEVHAAKADVGEGPNDYATFSEQAIIYLPVSVKADAKPGHVSLDLLLTFQSCNENMCMAPVFDHKLNTAVEIVNTAALAAAPPPPPSAMFGKFDGSVFAKIHAGAAPSNVVPTPPQPPSSANPQAAESPRPNFFGITLPRTDGPFGLLILALLSMLGGFILNLTPCVLPIIPIKILTISQHASTPGKSLYLGLWMAIGVVAFWAGIGIPAALFTAAADPSRLFGIWWLTLAIGLLIGAMGVGIMGLFTIQLPNSVYAVNPKADTAWGSFLFGIMTAVLGLPCFGFVAGALLAGAATLPAITIMIIFTSIGIGMAAPYLVLAAKPALVNKIPRTGPASELVKQVMGLLLLAAAAYFVGSGLIALVIDYPYLGKQLHWWVASLAAVGAGLWLIIRTFQISSKPLPRIVFTVIGIVLGGLAVMYSLDSTAKAKSIWIARQAQELAKPGEYLAGVWNPYTTASFEKARADGKVVVLDFTAEWCLTCKVLKAQVLNPDPVKTALQSKDVVPFTVDLTSNTDPGWDFLRSLGMTGIPTLAIYTPGNDAPWTANAYTSDQVIEALNQASQNRVAVK